MGEINDRIKEAHLQRVINTLENTKQHLQDAASLMELEEAGKVRDILYRCDALKEEISQIKEDINAKS